MPDDLTRLPHLNEREREIAERAGRATPGPHQARFIYRMIRLLREHGLRHGLLPGTDNGTDWQDAELWANAQDDIRYTLQRVSALAGERQRLFDLVRFCRHKLLEEDLITQEEFSEILIEGSVASRAPDGGSVKRLESYDHARSRMNVLAGEVEAKDREIAELKRRDETWQWAVGAKDKQILEQVDHIDSLSDQLSALRAQVAGMRRSILAVHAAILANGRNYLAYGDGFTFCMGCGEREPHVAENAPFAGAANPTEIKHARNCPQKLQWDAQAEIDAALVLVSDWAEGTPAPDQHIENMKDAIRNGA